MRSDTILDYAVFQLSPKHSRCELFVSSNGQTEKLASGLIQPFVNNLRVLEAQAAQGGQSSIRLEVEKSKDGETWFTKGTLERFVQFVCNPEVLERVSTFDLEMSQLEAARNLYSQGNEDRQYGGSDYGGGMADATKKELYRAIDLRLDAVKKDLIMAISNASASGFNPDSVLKLQLLADRFGAHRLDEACSKFVSLWQRRPYLIDLRNLNVNAQTSQSLRTPDMSVNEPSDDHNGIQNASRSNLPEENRHHPSLKQADMTQKQNPVEQSEQQTQQCPKSTKKVKDEKKDGSSTEESSTVRPGHTRRLSVQDRINLFESKQKENSNSGAKPVPPGKSTELRRLSSDVSSAPTTEKSVLRRWSIVSDLGIDLASDKKLDTSTESPLCTPLSVPHAKGDLEPKESNEKDKKEEKGSGNDVCSIKSEPKSVSENVGYQGAPNLRMKSSTAEVENKMDSGIQVTSGSLSESDIDSNHSSDTHVKGGVEFKVKDVQCHDTDENVSSQPQRRSFTGRRGKKEIVSSNKQSDTTDSQRAVSQKPISADSEQKHKSSGGRDDGNDGNDWRVGQENMDRIPMTSMDQVQRTGQSKGYFGVNDELKMKANELEKLFAEHKLRVPGDQSSSSGYDKQAETGVVQTEQSFSSGFAVSEAPPRPFPDKRNLTMYPGGGSGDFSKLITPTGKVVGDNGDLLRRNFSDLCFSNDSRGKFYEKYMQKRDAKLREEWSSNRAEKETKLKSMQEALELSKSEMKAKFSGFSDKQNSLSSTRHRAEKLRSFNSRASMKKYQHPISSFQSEEDEDFSEYSDQKSRVKDKTSNGQAIGNNATSRSFQAKKLQPNRNVSSVNPRTTTTSIPKPSAKVSNTNSGRRRSEKPLAQSVPNFSDLKKENTKPSSLVAKTTTRTQGRNAAPVKQEKLRRPQSLRKSSSGNIEFTELSTLYSDDVLAPARVDTEKNQRNVIDVDHVTGFIQEVKATDTSENLKNEGYDELDSEVEVPKEEEPEELEMVEVEDDDEKPRMSEEYDQVDNTRTGDTTLRSNSQIDSSSMTDLPATVPSTFHTVASLLDSPGESPLSWNSNMQHPFGYPNEHSDIDASMDSPIGSPASWSSRMRKKWGAAQNPAMIANSSQLQSRKDLTKGFKRLLKFGRKGRAAESFVDWVSVTTSEGDDDAEDRRDLANRSSDDLRKSRMGSLQSHLSEDGFHESEFNDQASNSSIHAPPSSFKLKEDHQISGSSNKAPRASFFSLSTFRNKGNDMKPR